MMSGRRARPAEIDASRLGDLLRRTVRPTDTGEPWLRPADIAERVSERRGRPCPVEEVAAALRPGNVPATDIVRAALELRAELKREESGSAAVRRAQADDEEFIARALRTDAPAQRRRRRASALANTTKKKTAWAVGIMVAAGLTLLATGVIPAVLRQFINGAAIEDAIRGGPAITVTEGIYTDGPVPAYTVIPPHQPISASLLRAIARPAGVGDPALARFLLGKGVAGYSLQIRIIAQGNRNESVRIIGIEPVDLHRSPPLHGVLFATPSQGIDANAVMGFDLDQVDPSAHDLNVVGIPQKGLYFLTHTISLAAGEQVVTIVEAYTRDYDVTFNLGISYIVGQSSPRTMIIDNGGRPFHVTATEPNAYYAQVYNLQSNFSVSTKPL